jgi:hypothetical protein
MMDGSTLVIVAMVAMMALMCGGMVAGGAWAFIRRRRHGKRRALSHGCLLRRAVMGRTARAQRAR